jgi:hypothetical protein
MIRIASNNNISTLLRRSLREVLHPSDKRAGSIDHFCGSLFQIVLHLRRNAVSPDYSNGFAVCFDRGVNSGNSQAAESFHLLGVVDQWTKRTNWSNAFCDGVLDHFHGPLDAKTESEFFGK